MAETGLLIALAAAVLVVAFLYSAVGHAGASGYIAVMTLFGIAAAGIRPTALILNILVAAITTFQFWKAGHFSWRLFWPFALMALPCAFLAGRIDVPARLFHILVGTVLLFSAARFGLRRGRPEEPKAVTPAMPAALLVGALLGFMAGLTGTGGGIFLTPMLLFMGWARTKTAGAVSAAFILVNSASGLAGWMSAQRALPAMALPLLGAALVGGTAGSFLGSRKLPHTAIQRLLALVLLIAGAKLLFTA